MGYFFFMELITVMKENTEVRDSPWGVPTLLNTLDEQNSLNTLHKHFTCHLLQFSLVKLPKMWVCYTLFTDTRHTSAFRKCCNSNTARAAHGLSMRAGVGAQKLNFWCPILHRGEGHCAKTKPVSHTGVPKINFLQEISTASP